MQRNQIIHILSRSNLDLRKVWLLCGGAMVMQRAKSETADIDLESLYSLKKEKSLGEV